MNRREMLRRLAIGASGLVVAESVRDFMAWEAKRIFALGEARGPKDWRVTTLAEFQHAIRYARDGDTVLVAERFSVTGNFVFPATPGRRIVVTSEGADASIAWDMLGRARSHYFSLGRVAPDTMYAGLRFENEYDGYVGLTKAIGPWPSSPLFTVPA